MQCKSDFLVLCCASEPWVMNILDYILIKSLSKIKVIFHYKQVHSIQAQCYIAVTPH